MARLLAFIPFRSSPRTTITILQHQQSRSRMLRLLMIVLSYTLSWRTLAIILAYLNLKNLPGAWHIRLFLIGYKYRRDARRNRNYLVSASEEDRTIHPLFRPVTLHFTNSLYDCDYNIHKSNSTYFKDLDHSRSQLVFQRLIPAIGQHALVPSDRNNHPALKTANIKHGILLPILGSVHTSFLREIKPLQKYSIRSRFLCWDRKWMVIASFIVRPPTRKEKSKARREGNGVPTEILLACSLAKYVIKQGRRTIDPALALAGSGWFDYPAPSSMAARTSAVTDATSPVDSTRESSPNPLPKSDSAVIGVAENVQNFVSRSNRSSFDSQNESSATKALGEVNDLSKEQIGGWTLQQIEDERQRGLKIVENWMNLDVEMKADYANGFEAGWLR